VVATANDVRQLPPEFLRKGRFDDLFHVDLPNKTERMAIWCIQIAKYGRDPQNFDLEVLVDHSEGMTGAEIEQAMIDALYSAFACQKEPSTEDILQVLKDQVPLGTLMKEEITRLQNWAQGRARSASSSHQSEPIPMGSFATN
jgi:SpoVK/Ycf46/Vps4 family AAA+-type ATPase